MSDLVERLREEANKAKNWLNVRELLNDAVAEIEKLRAGRAADALELRRLGILCGAGAAQIERLLGAVSSGQSLSEIKSELKAKPCAPAAPNADAQS